MASIPSTKDAIANILSKLSANIEHYEMRESQLDFIHLVDDVITHRKADNSRRHVIGELPTGTGKTLAGLIPAIAHLEHERAQGNKDYKVVYSTATINLQLQLLKEIKRLQNMGCEFTARVAVGRGRYLCKKHCETLLRDTKQQDFLSDDEDKVSISEKDRTLIKRSLKRLDDRTWSGVEDDLDETLKINKQLWSKMRSEKSTCSHNCTHYKNCPFINARNELKKADLVVANHAMVVADLDTNSILPAPDNALYIFDEGHHLHTTFRNAQQSTASMKHLAQLSTKLGDQLTQAIIRLSKVGEVKNPVSAMKLQSFMLSFKDNVNTLLNQLDLARVEALTRMDKWQKEKACWQISEEEIAKFGLDNCFDFVLADVTFLANTLEAVIEAIKSRTLGNDDENLQMGVQKHYSNIDDCRATLQYFLNRKKYSAIALWSTFYGDGKAQINLHACEVNTAPAMQSKLWSRSANTIVMSATLTSVGTFDRIVNQLGCYQKDTATCALSTPFAKQFGESTLHLYPQFPDIDWRNEAKHTLKISEEVVNFMSYHRAGLMLFVSKRQMEAFLNVLPPHLREITLAQGEDTRHSLVNRHKAIIDAGKQSLLVGVSSFSEGLDLQGQYLTFVGISKVPFANQNDPISEKEAEYIVNNGGNAFAHIALPDASKALNQAVGRLIRSVRDTGEVAIFDSRLVNKQYGGQLLDSLPPFHREYHYQQNHRYG
jgi:ATP-dependent DNA helicase DinG